MVKGPKTYYAEVRAESRKLLKTVLELVGGDRLRAKVVLWATLELLKREQKNGSADRD